MKKTMDGGRKGLSDSRNPVPVPGFLLTTSPGFICIGKDRRCMRTEVEEGRIE